MLGGQRVSKGVCYCGRKVANLKINLFSATKQDRVGPSLQSRSADQGDTLCPPPKWTACQFFYPFFFTFPKDFPLFVRLWASKTKEDAAQSCPWACLEKKWVRTCKSLTVLNAEFGG